MFTTLTAAGVAVTLFASSGYALAQSSDDPTDSTDTPGAVAPEQDRDRDRLQLHDPDDCVFHAETGELANRNQVRDREGDGDEQRTANGEGYSAENGDLDRDRDQDGSLAGPGAHLGSDTAPREGRAQGRG